MKPDHTVTILIAPRWWVAPYLRTLAAFCDTIGTEPDMDKVIAFILKFGFRIITK